MRYLALFFTVASAAVLKEAKHDLPHYCGRFATIGADQCVERELLRGHEVFVMGSCPDGSDVLLKFSPSRNSAVMHVEAHACGTD